MISNVSKIERTNSIFTDNNQRIESMNVSNIDEHDFNLFSPAHQFQKNENNNRYINRGSEDSLISNNLYELYKKQLEFQGMNPINEASASKEESSVQ